MLQEPFMKRQYSCCCQDSVILGITRVCTSRGAPEPSRAIDKVVLSADIKEDIEPIRRIQCFSAHGGPLQ